MSFSLPTLFDVAGALIGVAGSPVDIKMLGLTELPEASFANAIRPADAQLRAKVLIGVKPSSAGDAVPAGGGDTMRFSAGTVMPDGFALK